MASECLEIVAGGRASGALLGGEVGSDKGGGRENGGEGIDWGISHLELGDYRD